MRRLSVRRVLVAAIACACCSTAAAPATDATEWQPWKPTHPPSVWHEHVDHGVALLAGEVGCVRSNVEGPTHEEETREAAVPGPVTVSLSGHGSVKLTIDPCSEHRQRIAGHRWRAQAFGIDPSADGNWPTFELTVPPGRTETQHYRYTVTVGTALVAKGSITIGTRFHPSRPIHEGEDAFVNYCIDEGRRVESLEGKLYCFGPDYTSYTTRVTGSPAA
jgi:hypothetical protein